MAFMRGLERCQLHYDCVASQSCYKAIFPDLDFHFVHADFGVFFFFLPFNDDILSGLKLLKSTCPFPHFSRVGLHTENDGVHLRTR